MKEQQGITCGGVSISKRTHTHTTANHKLADVAAS